MIEYLIAGALMLLAKGRAEDATTTANRRARPATSVSPVKTWQAPRKPERPPSRGWRPLPVPVITPGQPPPPVIIGGEPGPPTWEVEDPDPDPTANLWQGTAEQLAFVANYLAFVLEVPDYWDPLQLEYLGGYRAEWTFRDVAYFSGQVHETQLAGKLTVNVFKAWLATVYENHLEALADIIAIGEDS